MNFNVTSEQQRKVNSIEVGMHNYDTKLSLAQWPKFCFVLYIPKGETYVIHNSEKDYRFLQKRACSDLLVVYYSNFHRFDEN